MICASKGRTSQGGTGRTQSSKKIQASEGSAPRKSPLPGPVPCPSSPTTPATPAPAPGNSGTCTGLLRQHSGKESACQCRRCRRHGFDPWVWDDPLEEEVATHSSILAGKISWTGAWRATFHGVTKSQTQVRD